MDRQGIIILSILFIIILLGSLGFFIYNVFNNTTYPDEPENLEDTTSFEESDAQNLTQMTLYEMHQDMTELPGGYLLPPPKTKFQSLLPSLLDN